MQTMKEGSPVGDSKSNGFIERTIQSVQGQIRTMKAALEARLGTKVATNSPMFSWMAVHAANILNMFETSSSIVKLKPPGKASFKFVKRSFKASFRSESVFEKGCFCCSSSFNDIIV